MAMATKRTTARKAAPAAAPAAQPELNAAQLASFLGLKDHNAEQMDALLRAAIAAADQFIGQPVPLEKQSHLYQQGVRHLAAKFYAAGTSTIEGPGDLPLLCRYLFELVRRELSGPTE
jgi:hypothetical protein